MSTVPNPRTGTDGAPRRPPTAPWVRRYIAEVVRGRHVILYGNVHDAVLRTGEFITLRTALNEILTALGFNLVAFYDQVDGLTAAGDTLARMHGLATGDTGSTDRAPVSTGDTDTTGAGGDRAARTAARRGQLQDSFNAGADVLPQLTNPQQALPEIRRVLAQREAPAAVVIDFAELLLNDPEHNDRPDRELLALVKKTMIEAAEAGARPRARNQLTLIAPDLGDIPAWLYRREPFVVPLEIPRPAFEERYAYLDRDISQFFATREPVAPHAIRDSVRTLATLSEGMSTHDLAGLRRTSILEQIPITEPRELINRAVFGQREDPWARLSGHMASAYETLAARVIGQEAAVRQVARTLTGATTGLGFDANPYNLEARPKGVFFFTGPTGTGKTELAKALAELIFGDEAAMIRFDMSSFAESHAAERLAGAPPGFVGHERGGELTNAVAARPFSLLLFDEIEKANPAVLDKFLQILEDGRLTDGMGRTTYFSRTLIVFTSNIGATEVVRLIEGGGPLPDYAQIADVFTRAVRARFTELGRPELLGRIGNGVIAFDILRDAHVPPITGKFLKLFEDSAQRADISIDIHRDSVVEAVRTEMRDPAALVLGGRRIRTALERLVQEPLAEEIETRGPRPGTFRIAIEQGGTTRITRRDENRQGDR